jgi:hypothetical protein
MDNASEEPRPLHEELKNVEEVVNAQPDRFRRHEVETTDLLHEIAGLRETRDELQRLKAEGNASPETLRELEATHYALWEAQTEAAARGLVDGSQD